METTNLSSNLSRLLQHIEEHGHLHSRPPTKAKERIAKQLAEAMPLSHTTRRATFGNILNADQLSSPKRLVEYSKNSIDENNPPVEYRLGTEDSVFLFAGPFSFPVKFCGFLWRADLERREDVEGDASPFDSGGLVDVFSRPDASESKRTFLDRHRLPLGKHREYLQRKMVWLFEDPWYYVDAPQDDVEIDDPVIGLTGGDRRRWTHEVRILGQLPLRADLIAVFLPRGEAGQHEVGLGDLQAEGVDILRYESDEGDFAVMQDECRSYLKNYLEMRS